MAPSSPLPVPAPSVARHTWMDLFRGLAVMLVAAGHSADHTTARSIRLTLEVLGDYRIPALLLLSGILLPRSLAKPPRAFCEGKARRIAWPFLVWSVVMLPIFGLHHVIDPRWWLLGELSHVWYLNALLMYYLLALLTRRIPPIWIAAALTVAAIPLALLHHPSDAPGMVWNRAYYGVFFFLGATIQPWLERIIRLPWWTAALAAAVSVPWIVHTVSVGHALNSGGIAAIMSAVGLLLVVWVAPRIPRGRVVRALEWLGRSSIVIYLVHFPAMFAWHQIGFDAVGVWHYLVMFALTLGAGVGAVLLRPWSWFLYELPPRRVHSQRAERVRAAG